MRDSIAFRLNGKPVRLEVDGDRAVTALSISSDDRFVFCGTRRRNRAIVGTSIRPDAKVWVWDLRGGAEHRELPASGGDYEIRFIARLDATDRVVWSASTEDRRGFICSADPRGGDSWRLEVGFDIEGMDVTPDGRLAVVAGDDTRVVASLPHLGIVSRIGAGFDTVNTDDATLVTGVATHVDTLIQWTYTGVNSTTGRTANFNTATTFCSNYYCHSDGKNTMVAGPTGNGHAPAWTTTFATMGGDRCAKCHGNSPQTAAHDAHQVGLHYNNVFNGTSGKLAAAAAGNSSHGVPGQSTTITCNTCHYKTMTVSTNDQNALCNTCHTKGVNGALVKGNAKIADFTFHVNGKKEIAFPTGKGGEFYVEDLGPGIHVAYVEQQGRRYRCEMKVPSTDDMIVDLGRLTCEDAR